jgi:hypothetical protein
MSYYTCVNAFIRGNVIEWGIVLLGNTLKVSVLITP